MQHQSGTRLYFCNSLWPLLMIKHFKIHNNKQALFIQNVYLNYSIKTFINYVVDVQNSFKFNHVPNSFVYWFWKIFINMKVCIHCFIFIKNWRVSVALFFDLANYRHTNTAQISPNLQLAFSINTCFIFIF